MRKTLLIALMGLSLTAVAQSTGWYKQLTGTIGKYPVTMHLHKAGPSYFGYYYYNSQQAPIYFNGDDTLGKGTVHLTAFASPDATEEFSFTWNGTTATGTWKKETGSHALPFSGREAPGPALTFVYTEGEKKLAAQLAASPQASFFAAGIWPAGNTEQDAFLKKTIGKMYDETAAEVPVGQLMLRKKENFFRQYAADFKDVKPADFKETSFLYTADLSERILLVYHDGRLATVADFVYSYSGGAHGNYSTRFRSVDLAGKKQLKLQDVLTPAGQKQLSSLLAKALRAQFKLKPTDALTEVLFENRIAPNTNFYVTGKGIGFVYNPYEIAAYAVGEINLFIPFKSLQNGLQPAFQKLLSP